MTAQEPIIASLVANLLANVTIAGYVSTRVYDTMAPQDPTLPFIVVTIAADVPQLYFNGAHDLGPLEFQVDVYGKVETGAKAVRTIGDAVYAAFMGNTSITASGYSGMSIICTNRGANMDQDQIVGGRTQQDSWRQMLLFKLAGTGS